MTKDTDFDNPERLKAIIHEGLKTGMDYVSDVLRDCEDTGHKFSKETINDAFCALKILTAARAHPAPADAGVDKLLAALGQAQATLNTIGGLTDSEHIAADCDVAVRRINGAISAYQKA